MFGRFSEPTMKLKPGNARLRAAPTVDVLNRLFVEVPPDPVFVEFGCWIYYPTPALLA